MKVRKKDGVKYFFGGGAMANATKAVVGAATGASGGAFVGGALQAAAGIGQTIYGMNQLKKANAQMDELLAGAPSLRLPSAYGQYAQKALDQSALRQQTEAINRRLSTSTDALSKAGGRALLGGLQSQVTAANAAEVQAQDAQRQREMTALQTLGAAQAQNQGLKENRFRMQYGAADAAKQAALANIGGGIGAAAGGLQQSAGSFDEYAKGGSLNGKKGGKTQGKFSHAKNPIDLVQDGEKIGEATGDEIILNPTQAKAIKKESKYFRNLLKKKRFK